MKRPVEQARDTRAKSAQPRTSAPSWVGSGEPAESFRGRVRTRRRASP